MIKTLPFAASAVVVVATAAGCAGMSASAPAPAMMSGGTLVAANGMTLYTFDKDTAGSGKSTCNGQCAALWPPLMATSSDKPIGAYTLVTRDDGSMQWAYKGKPVYFYKSDAKAGDRTGDNFRDIWHTIKE